MALDPEQLNPDKFPVVPLDDDHWQWFERACSQHDIPLDNDKRTRITALYSHLCGVNQWMNLTRITRPAEYLKFHILDSLMVLRLVRELTAPGDRCLDLGSGGGYPGLPLMTWLPDRNWILVDSRKKKTMFLREAIPLTGCPSASARTFRGRETATAAPDLLHTCAVVITRAIGRGDKILTEARPLVAPSRYLIMLKGPSYETEERRIVTQAANNSGFSHPKEESFKLEHNEPKRVALLIKRYPGTR